MQKGIVALVVLAAILPLTGCGKKEEPVTVENPPLVDKDTGDEEIPAEVEVDPKFKIMVKGAVFFLTNEERSTIGMDEEEAEATLIDMDDEELRPKLKSILESEPKGDLKFAAAKLLSQTPSDKAAYKDMILDVPVDFASGNPAYEQAAESWGYMAADFYRQSQDSDVLTALFTHDLEGAGAEIVHVARLDLVVEMPETILPKLNDVQLNNLGRYLDIASADPESDANKFIELTKSSNKQVASAADKVLAAFEAQQNSNEIESRVP